jgi:hypothetical protein
MQKINMTPVTTLQVIAAFALLVLNFAALWYYTRRHPEALR